MLTINGESARFCDGVSRRSFLQLGVLGLGGMTLPQLLRLKAQAATAGSSLQDTSIIFLELAGGPTHFETYDPKPEAPLEFRGPMGTVQTKLPGVLFSECMTEQAKIADRLAIIRSMTHDSSSHGTSSHLTQTGYYLRDRQSRQNDMPSAGSITAKVRGANASGMPAYVALPQTTRFGNAAYIGKQYNPLQSAMDADRPDFEVQNLSLNESLQLNRVLDRRGLLTALDHHRQVHDLEGTAQAHEEYTEQAFEMVTGAKAQKAFDIAKEKASVRETYGNHSEGQNLLLARRLVEAGVTFVTVRSSGWDMHNKVADRIRDRGVRMDQGLAALINDLHDRGMQRNVMVVAIGEFGRTPRINKNAGRDHWGAAMSVMLSGGDYKMGQIIGATNSKGEAPVDQPYRPEHVLTMMYRHLGIDTLQTFNDRSGRPRYVLERGGVIQELV